MHKPIPTCAYCDSPKETKDHVPPKYLFSKPRPDTLITVPSCWRCNKSFEKDDNYFVDALCFRDELSENPFVKKLNRQLDKRFGRREVDGYFHYLHKAMESSHTMTPSGIYIGEQAFFNVDLTRIRKTLDRVTKGMFHHIVGSRLPDGYGVDIYTQEWYLNLSESQKLDFKNSFLKMIIDRDFTVVVCEGFKYRVKFTTDNQNVSVWQFVFYDKYNAFAATLPEEHINREDSDEIYPPFIIP